MTVKAACHFYLSSGADEGPVLSTEGWLVLIIYAPHFKEFEGAYCVCTVRYFVRVFHRGLKHFFFFFFFFL